MNLYKQSVNINQVVKKNSSVCFFFSLKKTTLACVDLAKKKFNNCNVIMNICEKVQNSLTGLDDFLTHRI